MTNNGYKYWSKVNRTPTSCNEHVHVMFFFCNEHVHIMFILCNEHDIYTLFECKISLWDALEVIIELI